MRCVLFATALLAACETTAPPPTRYLTSDIFEDIPAPKDARYRDFQGESFSYRSQTFRCAKFIYDFVGPDATVVHFYKETMSAPPYSWTLTNEDRTNEGSTTLQFVKNQDTCTVDVDRVPRATQKKHVRIQVRVNSRR
ncbi:MAG: hypothetical protein ACYTF8_13190 [Planctomycetota bacterium]|jgi:hypothetical protein